MLIWIDATNADTALKVFGLTLVERHLQALALAMRGRSERSRLRVIVDLPEGQKAPPLAKKLTDRLHVAWRPQSAGFAQRLAGVIGAAGAEDVLLIDGATLVDPRLHGYFLGAVQDIAVLPPESGEYAAMVRVRAPHLQVLKADEDITQVAKRLLASGCVAPISAAAFDGFIRRLRRTLPFYLFRIEGRDKAAKVERFLFWSNYKGSTDLFTRYVYPPLVWLLVRPLARRRIHPNLVTLGSILLALGAIPLWAAGWFWSGFACAYAMSVLDSVDGKLARLTFTDSRLGNLLDHGLDLVHPPLWYLAWAYGLGGSLAWGTPLGLAATILCALYVADRLILAIYPRFFRRGFHTHSRLDNLARSVIARRNITLPLFLIGYAIGQGTAAFYLITAWQGATVLYHGLRSLWIFGIEKAHRKPGRPSDLAGVPRVG